MFESSIRGGLYSSIVFAHLFDIYKIANNYLGSVIIVGCMIDGFSRYTLSKMGQTYRRNSWFKTLKPSLLAKQKMARRKSGKRKTKLYEKIDFT